MFLEQVKFLICIGEELCARNGGERGNVYCPVSCFQGEITRNKTMCWSLGLGLGEITRGTKQWRIDDEPVASKKRKMSKIRGVANGVSEISGNPNLKATLTQFPAFSLLFSIP